MADCVAAAAAAAVARWSHRNNCITKSPLPSLARPLFPKPACDKRRRSIHHVARRSAIHPRRQVSGRLANRAERRELPVAASALANPLGRAARAQATGSRLSGGRGGCGGCRSGRSSSGSLKSRPERRTRTQTRSEARTRGSQSAGWRAESCARAAGQKQYDL